MAVDLREMLNLCPEQDPVEVVFCNGDNVSGTASTIHDVLKDEWLEKIVTDVAALGDTLKIWIK